MWRSAWAPASLRTPRRLGRAQPAARSDEWLTGYLTSATLQPLTGHPVTAPDQLLPPLLKTAVSIGTDLRSTSGSDRAERGFRSRRKRFRDGGASGAGITNAATTQTAGTRFTGYPPPRLTWVGESQCAAS
jgi:hypothetical protein